MTINFGFIPEPIRLESAQIVVEPLENLGAIVEEQKKTGYWVEDWFYPPRDIFTDPVNKKSISQPFPVPRFELPPTHTIKHRGSKSPARLAFLIHAIGFLLGTRALPMGDGHLSRAPMSLGMLTDFFPSPKDVETCIDLIDKTWLAATPQQRLMLDAAINAFQISQTYQHDFERLSFLYPALDVCYTLHRSTHRAGVRQEAHWMRARELCRDLKIPIPAWARKQPEAKAQPGGNKPKTNSRLSKLRNALSHEGIYALKPIGYGVDVHNTIASLEALVSRAIVMLMGVRCRYTSTPVDTRQVYALDILP